MGQRVDQGDTQQQGEGTTATRHPEDPETKANTPKEQELEHKGTKRQEKENPDNPRDT